MENMEYRTIGHKRSGIGIAYIFMLVLAVGMFVAGCLFVAASKEFDYSCIMFFLGGLLAGIYSVVQLIEFYSTKPDVISTNGEKMKVNDNVFNINDIVDVSYRKARYRGGEYNHGNITITTKDSSYVAQFVSNCESVSKEITKLMYEKKNSKA